MCGRYGFIPGKNFYKRFKIDKYSGQLKPVYNAAPGMKMPVIIRQSPNQAIEMKWGLVPNWAKDPRIGYKMINARAETLESRPAFRSLLHTKRCLVPANGFYEWEHKGKTRTPYYIKLKDNEMFTFAGLYDTWKDAEGKMIMSYTIITTDSNPLVAKIHDRMPVILKTDLEDKWLGEEKRCETGDVRCEKRGIDELLAMLKPYPEGEMQAYQVSSLVNSPKNDREDLIEPIE